MSQIVSNLKEAIAECPICTEFFNEEPLVPRRMPCCSQAICERCLETIIGRRPAFSCPMCKTRNNLPGGVKSLPKEVVVLRFLEALKTERNAVPLCTDCPDDHKAMSKCDHCGVYLCQPCLTAHKRHKATREHKTTTFEAIKTNWQVLPSSALRKQPSELAEKLETVSARVNQLSGMLTNVDKSKKAAQSLINKSCDELVEEVQQRRAILLSQLEDKAEAENTSIKRVLDSHKQYQEKLKKASTKKQSAASTRTLLQEAPTDLKQQRVGLIFSEANLQHILEAVRSAGLVRVVTFTPTERPSWAGETALFDAVKIVPDIFPQVIGDDQTIVLDNKAISCPQLEWEKSVAGRNIIVTPTELRNTTTVPSTLDTGCSLISGNRAITSRPLVVDGNRFLFRLNLLFNIKSLLQENSYVFELCLNTNPIDTGKSNFTFLNVLIMRTTREEDKVILFIGFLCKTMKRIEVSKNMVGASCDLAHYFLLDGVDGKMHMVDAHDGSVLFSTSCSFDNPLWIMSSVSGTARVDMTHEIVSGRQLSLNMKMESCLANLLK